MIRNWLGVLWVIMAVVMLSSCREVESEPVDQDALDALTYEGQNPHMATNCYCEGIKPGEFCRHWQDLLRKRAEWDAKRKSHQWAKHQRSCVEDALLDDQLLCVCGMYEEGTLLTWVGLPVQMSWCEPCDTNIPVVRIVAHRKWHEEVQKLQARYTITTNMEHRSSPWLFTTNTAYHNLPIAPTNGGRWVWLEWDEVDWWEQSRDTSWHHMMFPRGCDCDAHQ